MLCCYAEARGKSGCVKKRNVAASIARWRTWAVSGCSNLAWGFFGMQEEARDEEDAHEAAFWNDPLQAAI